MGREKNISIFSLHNTEKEEKYNIYDDGLFINHHAVNPTKKQQPKKKKTTTPPHWSSWTNSGAN